LVRELSRLERATLERHLLTTRSNKEERR
jgi:hypothetical protein